ncbi:hypothetical protein AAVH_15385 [Aphelenchoides avenae]|nr:hypothetical protein AAVH_30074 [Aphelenchus avenae]KAH7717196.1 hypothetical protein AAVH_15385 [Aphelenchus avenae]
MEDLVNATVNFIVDVKNVLATPAQGQITHVLAELGSNGDGLLGVLTKLTAQPAQWFDEEGNEKHIAFPTDREVPQYIGKEAAGEGLDQDELRGFCIDWLELTMEGFFGGPPKQSDSDQPPTAIFLKLSADELTERRAFFDEELKPFFDTFWKRA